MIVEDAQLGALYFVRWYGPHAHEAKAVGWCVGLDEKELILAQTFSMTPLPVVRIPCGTIREIQRYEEP